MRRECRHDGIRGRQLLKGNGNQNERPTPDVFRNSTVHDSRFSVAIPSSNILINNTKRREKQYLVFFTLAVSIQAIHSFLSVCLLKDLFFLKKAVLQTIPMLLKEEEAAGRLNSVFVSSKQDIRNLRLLDILHPFQSAHVSSYIPDQAPRRYCAFGIEESCAYL